MSRLILKLKQNIFLTTGIFIIFNIILSFILYLFNIRFQIWVINIIMLLSLIGLSIGIIKSICNKTWRERINIICCLICFFLFLILLGVFMPFIAIIALYKIPTEHTVIVDNKKYVAVINTFIKYVDVNYYNYYGPFLMGTKVKINGNFGKITSDPYLSNEDSLEVYYTYYDDKGSVVARAKDVLKKDKKGKFISTDKEDIYNYDNSFNESDYYLLPEEAEVLYEKKFNNTVLRFVKVDNVLGQRLLVKVIKSKDGGKNFYYITDSSIQMNDNARYKFLNEDLGFASNDKIYLDGHISGLKVTNDGGKTFYNTNFVYKNSGNEFITIEDLPYYEEDTLKIKCSVYVEKNDSSGYEDKELIFISKDKGLNWQLQ